mmetsp:Transcript_10212/g.41353  ORF Transcript_10212/g.41353 Transcript_10212/m.41353 type:complete len:275 (+) Transcript_10212:743-1567(+)
MCTPPKAYDSLSEYQDDIISAGQLSRGRFVFTSSGGVYEGIVGGIVREQTATSDTPRALALVAAEDEARRYGAVARLAGLYGRSRGAHHHWFRQAQKDEGKVHANPNSVVNQVWYGDAARAIVRMLEGGADTGDVCLVSDMNPRTRREICSAVAPHPYYRWQLRPEFTIDDEEDYRLTENGEFPKRGPTLVGRVYDCRETMLKLKWLPIFPSIESFFKFDATMLRQGLVQDGLIGIDFPMEELPPPSIVQDEVDEYAEREEAAAAAAEDEPFYT